MSHDGHVSYDHGYHGDHDHDSPHCDAHAYDLYDRGLNPHANLYHAHISSHTPTHTSFYVYTRTFYSAPQHTFSHDDDDLNGGGHGGAFSWNDAHAYHDGDAHVTHAYDGDDHAFPNGVHDRTCDHDGDLRHGHDGACDTRVYEHDAHGENDRGGDAHTFSRGGDAHGVHGDAHRGAHHDALHGDARDDVCGAHICDRDLRDARGAYDPRGVHGDHALRGVHDARGRGARGHGAHGRGAHVLQEYNIYIITVAPFL